MIVRVPVRVRIGCSVTTVGEIDVDHDDPSGSFVELAAVLEAAAQDARRHAEEAPWSIPPEATTTG